jgi:hypothetical protein
MVFLDCDMTSFGRSFFFVLFCFVLYCERVSYLLLNVRTVSCQVPFFPCTCYFFSLLQCPSLLSMWKYRLPRFLPISFPFQPFTSSFSPSSPIARSGY